MDWIGVSVLVLLMKLVSSASISTSSAPNNEELTYQVTENIIDIPDNRTLPPVIQKFTLGTPLNLGNSSIALANQNGENSEDNSVENSENNISDNVKTKKTTISITHISAESSDKPIKNHGIHKVLGGIKDYFYSLKKGVVDGLHSFFHKDDKRPEGGSYIHKLHRDYSEGFHHLHGEDFDEDDVDDSDEQFDEYFE